MNANIDAKAVAMIDEIDRGGLESLLAPVHYAEYCDAKREIDEDPLALDQWHEFEQALASEHPVDYPNVDVLRYVVRDCYLRGLVSTQAVVEAWESTP